MGCGSSATLPACSAADATCRSCLCRRPAICTPLFANPAAAPPLPVAPLQYYANSHYAQVAGVSLRELNVMELDLLDRLDYRWGRGTKALGWAGLDSRVAAMTVQREPSLCRAGLGRAGPAGRGS